MLHVLALSWGELQSIHQFAKGICVLLKILRLHVEGEREGSLKDDAKIS